jgi:hypothetical protein
VYTVDVVIGVWCGRFLPPLLDEPDDVVTIPLLEAVEEDVPATDVVDCPELLEAVEEVPATDVVDCPELLEAVEEEVPATDEDDEVDWPELLEAVEEEVPVDDTFVALLIVIEEELDELVLKKQIISIIQLV